MPPLYSFQQILRAQLSQAQGKKGKLMTYLTYFILEAQGP